MTDLDARLAALSPAKRALLERMAAPAPRPGPVRIPDGPAPLSAEQRRLWYLLQLAGDRPVYVIPAAFRLTGPLDVEAMTGALRDLVQRHETLRTAFRESAGVPVQEVTDGSGFAAEVVDLRRERWAEPEANYQTDRFARRGFRLDAGEAFRATLIRVAEQDARLLLCVHHLAADGESLATLFRELGLLYQARREGRLAALPRPALRFRDWAAWQQTEVDAGRAAKEAYWRTALDGAPAWLSLPTDHPHPPAQRWEGSRRTWTLPGEAVRQLARRAGTTPQVVVAGAVGLLLARWSGADDLVVAAAVRNRPLPETDGMVGFFAGTLPLRVQVSGDPTPLELLARVHRDWAEAQANAGVPFDRLVELLGVRRDFRRPPLAQVIIGYTDPIAPPVLAGLEVEPLEVDAGTSVFELTLLFEAGSAGIRVTQQHATSLWDPRSMRRIGPALARVVRWMHGRAGDPVSRLPLEARKLPGVRRWEEPARAVPTAPAVPMTPLEAALAGHWAAVLERTGVGPEDDFFDLGGQSILAVRLAARIRDQLGVTLPVGELLRAPTVRAMAAAIERGRGTTSLPLVPLQTFGDRQPLFLAHPAGGHIACYRALASLLAPDQPVYAIQPRGVEDGLTPLEDVGEMAGLYLDAIRRVQPRGPYRFAGWSFGGLLSWEMARQVLAAGDTVELVGLLDTGPTGQQGGRIDPRSTAQVVWYTVAGYAGYGPALRVAASSLEGLSARDAVLAMIRGIAAPRLLDESAVDDLLRLTEVRAANLRAQEAYRPPALPVRATYFRTADSARRAELAGAAECWGRLSLGGLVLREVGGTHGSILERPFVESVAAELLRLG